MVQDNVITINIGYLENIVQMRHVIEEEDRGIPIHFQESSFDKDDNWFRLVSFDNYYRLQYKEEKISK